MFRKIFFYLQYLFFDPPWDTGISPPELMDFIETHEPGRALDVGCGTGTNVITLAEHGWQVVGVDYVPQAVNEARRKARKAGVRGRVEFQVGNVLDLEDLGPYDLVLDIGCFHTFGGAEVEEYARVIDRFLAAGGSLLLYAHLKEEPGSGQGAAEEDFQTLSKRLNLIHRQDGLEGESRRSAWLTYRKPVVRDSE